MKKEIICLKEVSKKYNITHKNKRTIFGKLFFFLGEKLTSEEFFALKDINLSIERGKTVCIIGPNGGGKTTLLKIISEIIKPSSGSVVVKGECAPFLEMGIGFNDELTAKENIFLYGAIMNLSKKQLKKQLHEILSFAGVERFSDMKLKRFSSGMKVRLAFSVLIRTKADILVLDEIFAVGDKNFRDKSIKVFEEMKRKKRTIVLASHSILTAKHYCDEFILIHKGKIVAQGYPEKVIDVYNKMKNGK